MSGCRVEILIGQRKNYMTYSMLVKHERVFLSKTIIFPTLAVMCLTSSTMTERFDKPSVENYNLMQNQTIQRDENKPVWVGG
jgi:hypothetical protein